MTEVTRTQSCAVHDDVCGAADLVERLNRPLEQGDAGREHLPLEPSEVNGHVDHRKTHHVSVGESGRQLIAPGVTEAGYDGRPRGIRHGLGQDLDAFPHDDARGRIGREPGELMQRDAGPGEHAFRRLRQIRVPDGRGDSGRRVRGTLSRPDLHRVPGFNEPDRRRETRYAGAEDEDPASAAHPSRSVARAERSIANAAYSTTTTTSHRSAVSGSDFTTNAAS